jgi:chemotaxis protein MotD
VFSVTPETAVAATSPAARSKQAPTAQPWPAGEGFAALVDDNAAAAAEHDRASIDASRGNTDDRQPRAGVVTGTKSRNDTPPKSDAAPADTPSQTATPTNQAPATQDPVQPTQVSTGVVPAGKHVAIIMSGQSDTGTDQKNSEQATTDDGQAAQTNANADLLLPGPVAVIMPTVSASPAPADAPTGDPANGVQGTAAKPAMIVPDNSLAAAAIANGAASAADTPAETATPAADANATAPAATTITDVATDTAAAAPATVKPDLTAGSPVNAEAAVTVAAAAPATVAATTKSTTTPAAIDMADHAKTNVDTPVITPADARPLPQAQAAAQSTITDATADGQSTKQDAVEAKADAPADDANNRKPTEARDVRSAAPSHDQRPTATPTLQPDPSLQAAGNAPLPQQPQIQPVTNAPIPASQLGVALATNLPVPLNGLAVDIALKAASGKSRFEIRLDPADLGRIEVRLDVDKHGNVTSHLTVEKPATLDMLRKDAPQLQRALEDAGLKTGDSGLQFSLRDQSQSGQQNDSGAGRNAHRLIISEDDAIPAPIAGKTYARMLGASSGVDIRV